MGAQSEGATRRAARLTDGVFFGPQVAWRDIAGLARVFRDRPRRARGRDPGYVSASRSLIVGASKEAARAAAREYLERTLSMYRTWQMQESTMVELQLSPDVPLDDWTVNGSPEDCVEAIARAPRWGSSGSASHLQPAARGRGPHRLHADDRRARPPARGRDRGDRRSGLLMRRGEFGGAHFQ